MAYLMRQHFSLVEKCVAFPTSCANKITISTVLILDYMLYIECHIYVI